ncbi:hypothetical protein T459_27659 [Capsicum annuum]|uniref:Protein kinase domain-containing protein n=1 Tax=Capsicum annuum TaxID=4072 RepID=A0A2G2YEJ0_CAPAN|nr:hypothetical protein T459_27659 [Capsicum annuum]
MLNVLSHVIAYTHGHDGKSFVDERSRIVHERFEEILREKILSESEIDQIEAYYQAVGGEKKRRVFDLGSEAKGYYGQTLCVSCGKTSSSASHESCLTFAIFGNVDDVDYFWLMFAGFFKLPALDIRELDNNYFTGQLPTEINANNLTKLVLSNNWITRTIPPSIGKLKNLVTLSLDMNRLSGEIPEEIANLKKLLTIDLSGNNLTSEISSLMALCSELTLVDLIRNQLIGEVPNEIAKLRNLNALNLSRNQLNGAISGEIGGMNSLTILDLSYNDLSGRRPTNRQLNFFSGKADDVLECLKDENIIGKGEDGIVYQGSMSNGIDIAIKKLVNRGTGHHDHNLSVEIQTLGRIRHRNIM